MSDLYLKISGKEYKFFTSVDITLNYASLASSFSFTSLFEPENESHKRLFRPLSYRTVDIGFGGTHLIRGTILNNSYTHSATKQLANISGYTKSGVLQDCEIPLEAYPLQSDGRTLREITEKIIQPFGLSLIVTDAAQSDVDSVYDFSTADQKQSVAGYLTELAQQKGIIITHSSYGNLVFTKLKNLYSRESITENDALSISLQTSGQSIHSSITTQKQADVENDNAGESTVDNPYVSAFRPTVKTQNSGDDIDSNAAAQRALRNELRNIKITIELDRWTWGNSDHIITPGNLVTVKSPNNYLFFNTNLFIESVNFKGDNKSRTATLTCVPRQVYLEEEVKTIF